MTSDQLAALTDFGLAVAARLYPDRSPGVTTTPSGLTSSDGDRGKRHPDGVVLRPDEASQEAV